MQLEYQIFVPSIPFFPFSRLSQSFFPFFFSLCLSSLPCCPANPRFYWISPFKIVSFFPRYWTSSKLSFFYWFFLLVIDIFSSIGLDHFIMFEFFFWMFYHSMDSIIWVLRFVDWFYDFWCFGLLFIIIFIQFASSRLPLAVCNKFNLLFCGLSYFVGYLSEIVKQQAIASWQQHLSWKYFHSKIQLHHCKKTA